MESNCFSVFLHKSVVGNGRRLISFERDSVTGIIQTFHEDGTVLRVSFCSALTVVGYYNFSKMDELFDIC